MADTYQYTVRDMSGKLVTGALVADSQQLVVARLQEMGYIPIRISAKGSGLNLEINLRRKVRLKDLAVMSRQFATMVTSGLPILRSLAILEQQTESKVLAKAVSEIRVEIERGSSLSNAMAKHPKVFNDLFVAMVRAGEAGGVLEAVLLRLADNLEREVSLRRRIKSAMTYPVVVLCFVTLILMAMLLFIVPQFKSIYAQLQGTLPLPTRILLSVSETIRHRFLIVGAVVAILIYAFRRYKKTERGREQWDTLKLKFPIFG